MSSARREYVVLVVATLIWGSLHPTVKFALRELTPLQLALLRPVCACAVLMTLVVLSGRASLLGCELRRAPGTLLMLGALGYAGSGSLASLALGLLPAGITSLLANASPLMVVLGGLLFFQQPVGWLEVAGTMVGFAGVALLGLGGVAPTGGVGPTLVGGALALGAAAAWAIYTGVARRLAGTDPLATTAVTSAIGALLVALVAVPSQDWTRLASASTPTLLATLWAGAAATGGTYAAWSFALRRLPAVAVAPFAYLIPVSSLSIATLWAGAVATGGTYAAWSFALRRLPAVAVAPFAYLIPVSSLSIASLWLGEPLTPAIVTGALLVLSGVALTQSRNFRALLRARQRPASAAL